MSNGPCAALLERVDGDQEVFAELCDLFLEDAPVRLDAIHAALEAQDALALQRAAHAYKGAASVFDAADVVAAARRLEELGDQGDLREAQNVWTTLDAHSRALIETIRATRTAMTCRS